MIIANFIIKEKLKGGSNIHNNSQYFVENEQWVFSKMLAKGTHQTVQMRITPLVRHVFNKT